MKKAMLMLATVALVAGGFTSCKKGENDPFLSLRSRKARVTGTWNLTTSNTVETNVDSDNDGTRTTTDVASGVKTTLEEFLVGGSAQAGAVTTKSNYTSKMEINKDGTFTWTQTETVTEIGGVSFNGDQTTTTISGNWAFVGKSKESELKKKEAITLSPTSFMYNDGTNSSTTTSTGWQDPMVMQIDQLKNKEMIIIMDATTTYNDGSKDTWTGSETYEKE